LGLVLVGSRVLWLLLFSPQTSRGGYKDPKFLQVVLDKVLWFVDVQHYMQKRFVTDKRLVHSVLTKILFLLQCIGSWDSGTIEVLGVHAFGKSRRTRRTSIDGRVYYWCLLSRTMGNGATSCFFGDTRHW
jgi:hypothetical protein